MAPSSNDFDKYKISLLPGYKTCFSRLTLSLSSDSLQEPPLPTHLIFSGTWLQGQTQGPIVFPGSPYRTNMHVNLQSL